MVALSAYYKSKARFHLMGASNQGIPAGDVARIEEAINNIADQVTVTYVNQQIDRCDVAYDRSEFQDTAQIVSSENYAGDINRTVTRAQRNQGQFKLYWEIYYKEVDALARMLWVPEFVTPWSDHYRYARSGGEYINSIPGPQGPAGINPFTNTTSTFVQPAANASVVIPVVNGSWAAIGLIIFVETAGYYQVTSYGATSITGTNLNRAGAATAGTTIGLGAKVVVSG